MFKILHQIRRNHALEHATINLLAQRHPNAQIVGLSGPLGFTLYTTLTAEEVVPAAMQALNRLKAGENNLRIHQQCGTNLVVTATLTTLASLIGLSGDREKLHCHRLERLPSIILLNALALLFARPIAEWVQANITTAQDMDPMEITSIFTYPQARPAPHQDTYDRVLRRIGIQTRQQRLPTL
ncbi:MAG: hypothetical protein JXA33_05700 [Anaerolineae bacterium]|nr:hypothetical protein [Anaerolineae bacterium]